MFASTSTSLLSSSLEKQSFKKNSKPLEIFSHYLSRENRELSKTLQIAGFVFPR